MLSPREFDRMRKRQALLEEFATGVAQIEDGEGMTGTQVLKELRAARQRRKKQP